MKKFSVFAILCALHLHAFTQGCPPNIDFEDGNFSHWDCFIGSTYVSAGNLNVISLLPSAPVPGRHELITANSTPKDPYGNFPTLCPYGGNYSVKLGNDGVGSQAEGMSYTFQVPALTDTFTFTYYYAVVFQDPNHSPFEQPRFFVKAYDVLTGDPISCASYNYVSTTGIPGFQVSAIESDVLYKNWSPVSIQFAGLANRMVRLEFQTADCTRGGHFGYAYFDVGTGCSDVLATAPYCIETNNVVLNAPYGFKSYTWYNGDYSVKLGDQQSVTLNPAPPVNSLFHVDMIPYPGFGCRDTALARIVPVPVPDTPKATPVYDYCLQASATPLQAKALPDHDLLWYSTPTGGIGSSSTPVPSTATAGIFNYYVSQKKLFGCESLRRPVAVNVVPFPSPSFAINNDRQCDDTNRFVFLNTSTNLSNSSYYWDLGDGQSQFNPGPADTAHSYGKYGNYVVRLRVSNLPGCVAEKRLPITVVPKPKAGFAFPPVICELQTQVALTDTSSVPGNMSSIGGWWWNINGAVSIQKSPLFVPAIPGPYPVQLVAYTAEGCRSDTVTTLLPVHYRPNAVFNWSHPLCENEILRFNNTSFMPAAASPDFIARWYWQFDNVPASGSQNPGYQFGPGPHHAALVAESNYGCQSALADSLLVTSAKPAITIDINDSCILRNINFKAVDQLHTVDKWYWDFGNGLYRGSALATQTFLAEGYYPFTLVGQTVEGCRDTLLRPFTIYDNKALAGRDTIVAMNEPVQLSANAGRPAQYSWSPSTGLNNANIANPVATLDKNQWYSLEAITDKGCVSHSKILITRYKGPQLYIPNAFTPNGDGNNDVLKVFPVGIKTFTSFAVFNRYGQQIFYSTDRSRGWDGRFGGKPQESGTYVVVAQAIDYRGHMMLQKQTVILIR